MSAYRGIVLQNYFRGQIGQSWFKDEHRRATSIQNSVQPHSTIALSRRSEEFCNTIRGKADIQLTSPNAGF
jgi:hypothetical protein